MRGLLLWLTRTARRSPQPRKIWKFETGYSDYGPALADPRVDAVIIVTPTRAKVTDVAYTIINTYG
jgi:predicted dehydrogenase